MRRPRRSTDSRSSTRSRWATRATKNSQHHKKPSVRLYETFSLAGFLELQATNACRSVCIALDEGGAILELLHGFSGGKAPGLSADSTGANPNTLFCSLWTQGAYRRTVGGGQSRRIEFVDYNIVSVVHPDLALSIFDGGSDPSGMLLRSQFVAVDGDSSNSISSNSISSNSSSSNSISINSSSNSLIIRPQPEDNEEE